MSREIEDIQSEYIAKLQDEMKEALELLTDVLMPLSGMTGYGYEMYQAISSFVISHHNKRSEDR